MIDLSDVNIKHIKFVNGEEIVSIVDDIRGDNIILEHPLQLNSIMNNGGSYTYYFTKYMPLNDDVIVYANASNIIAYSNVSDDIKERYIKASISYKEDPEKEDMEVNRQMEKQIRSNLSSLYGEDYEEEFDSYFETTTQHTLH